MVATRPMTAEQLFEQNPDEGRFELVRGELRDVSPAGGNHGAIQMWLGSCIGSIVYQKHLGVLFGSDTGYAFTPTGDSVLAPDLSFISLQRLPEERIWESYIPIAPDLAVEIFSPSDNEADMLDKIGMYLSSGSRLVWLIRPKQRTVTVFQPDRPEYVLRHHDTLDGGTIIPGFEIAVSSIFDSLGK